MREKQSRLAGFHRLSPQERRAVAAEWGGLSSEDVEAWTTGGLSLEAADRMIENVVGLQAFPVGVAVNLRLDGRDRLAVLAIEEPSVVAGLSNAARLLRFGDGIRTFADPALMIAQIQVLDVPDPEEAAARIRGAETELLEAADAVDPLLVRAGGGARRVETRTLDSLGPEDPVGSMFVVHLLVDVRDAMGANAVNSMAEALAPRIEALTGGRVRLRILSNLADRRLVRAEGRVPVERLGGRGAEGPEVARGIVEASVFAERDPYRAATHNKGIMNGIDGLLLAAGQDWRAVEAGAHAYAARSGRYTALATWRLEDSELVGRLELPMAVGTVGGVVKVHPVVQANLKVMEVSSASDLARLAAAVGLAQNLAALRALATEGIQRGHMRLHARNLAAAVGARPDEVDRVVALMLECGEVHAAGAERALAAVRGGDSGGGP